MTPEQDLQEGVVDPRTTSPDGRPRARGLGIPLPGRPGRWNAITDVPGVTVGYVTLISGDGPLVAGAGPVRTGVTALLPRGAAGVGVPCAAGWWSLNGNGEMTGTTWIEEAGTLSLPVTITNTHAVGSCHRGTVDWVVRTRPDLAVDWLLPVAAETYDGYLNDINGAHVRPEHAARALDAATSGPLAEGSVGGGTGMSCYSFKGGTGTSSRTVTHHGTDYTVGVLLQANFGRRGELRVAGVPLGRTLADDNPLEDTAWRGADLARAGAGPSTALGIPGAGSVIVVVATDAPLLPGQCKALARRVPLGLARTGTSGSHFSGDIFLAFSTALTESRDEVEGEVDGEHEADGGPAGYETMRYVPWARLDPFYEAVVEAVEEAVLNALVVNADMTGRDGHRSPALPHGRLVDALTAAGVRATPDA